jgi:hypothetical protein
LMNYIQAKYKLPLSIVYKEDRAEYIQALKDSRIASSIKPFITFMFNQLDKQLSTEILLFKESSKPKPKPNDGLGFSMFF